MESMMMPAEWEPHEATWLSWPKDPVTFPPKDILPQVERIYVKMIAALGAGESVHVLVDDEGTEARVLDMLDDAGARRGAILHRIKTVDVWMRDYGPIFVRTKAGELKATKWTFNAWGGKYEELMKDDTVVDRIAPLLGRIPIERAGMILEGGSIDVNGRGTLLTTEQCLLNKNRNRQLSRKQIESNLSRYLGATNVVWLKEGIAGDDTDGHIDDIARFVSPSKVLCAMEERSSDPNHTVLKKDFDLLSKSRDQDGEPFEVVPLPMPGAVRSSDGRLPASYSNFYIGNRAVLLPIFGHENDEKAIGLVEEAFKGRKVVPLNCTPLVYGLGAIHCVTQQQPKA